jgi:phytoene dehydrogenase-like protein
MSTYTTLFEFMELMKEDIPLAAINDPRYPGTWGLPMAFADVIKEKGGEFYLNAVVDKIDVENGRVVGVSGMDTKYESRFKFRAPIVVSNLKAWDNFKHGLLSPNDFPIDWYHHAMALERFKSGAISIWTATNKKIDAVKGWHSWIRFLSEDDEEYTRRRGRTVCTHTYTRNRGGFGVQSAFCPSVAPPDKDLFSLTLWLTTDEIEREGLQRWVDEGYEAMRQFFKFICKEDYDKIRLWNKVIYHKPSWGVEMYAVHPHPDVKSHTIKGLWLVGDSIEGRGISGDHATNTGMVAAERIIAEG